jgi:hypothetical protein
VWNARIVFAEPATWPRTALHLPLTVLDLSYLQSIAINDATMAQGMTLSA